MIDGINFVSFIKSIKMSNLSPYIANYIANKYLAVYSYTICYIAIYMYWLDTLENQTQPILNPLCMHVANYIASYTGELHPCIHIYVSYII